MERWPTPCQVDGSESLSDGHFSEKSVWWSFGV
ncbi:hypothetical protein GBAR_LOCUS15579, partial [Geodia barretti]